MNIQLSTSERNLELKVASVEVGNTGISCEDPIVLENGKEIEYGENFQGYSFSADDAAESLLRAFINNDTSVVFDESSIPDNVREFKKNLMASTITAGDLQVPSHYLSYRGVLDLEAVDAMGCKYYSDGDEFVLTRPDGSIATDMEVFYANALTECVEAGTYLFLRNS